MDTIEKKLEERFYTSVATFSADIGTAFRSVVGLDDITDAHEAHEQLNEGGATHIELTPEQKDKKKLAKRIIKAIHPALEDATIKEAQIAGKQCEKELRELDALLDNSVSSRATSALASHDAIGKGNDDGAERHHVSQDVEMSEASGYLANGNAETSGLVNGDSDGKGNDSGTKHGDGKSGGADEPDHEADDAAIRLQLQLPEEPTEAPAENTVGESAEGRQGSIGTAPALSNSGSTHPSTTNPDPLTPPQSDGDILTLAQGGIPWYLQSFDPRGTTIHDERWSGREVVRGMSEELSELDDDELDGLLGEDDLADAPVEGQDSLDAEEGPAMRAQRVRARAQQRRKAQRRNNWG